MVEKLLLWRIVRFEKRREVARRTFKAVYKLGLGANEAHLSIITLTLRVKETTLRPFQSPSIHELMCLWPP